MVLTAEIGFLLSPPQQKIINNNTKNGGERSWYSHYVNLWAKQRI